MKKDFTTYRDSELVSELKGENAEAAFSQIYDRYNRKIYIYINTIIQDRTASEDILQEVFIAFFKFSSGKDVIKLQALLFKIARNFCLKYKRDNKKFVELNADMIKSEQPNSTNNELLDLVYKSLNLIKPEFREVYILREFDGLSYEEIGEVCSVSTGHARIRHFRAIKMIKKILEPYLNELEKFQ